MKNPTPTPAKFHTIWVKALRTGVNAETGRPYHQTQKMLRRSEADGNGFCCLGVACDIVAPYLIGAEWEECTERCDDEGDYKMFGEWGELPDLVCETLELDESDPLTNVVRTRFNGQAEVPTPLSLATLNDRTEAGDTFDFNAIADAIVGSDWYLGDPEA